MPNVKAAYALFTYKISFGNMHKVFDKGWGYSRPLRRPFGGDSGGHKACGCYTA